MLSRIATLFHFGEVDCPLLSVSRNNDSNWHRRVVSAVGIKPPMMGI